MPNVLYILQVSVNLAVELKWLLGDPAECSTISLCPKSALYFISSLYLQFLTLH